VFFYQAESTIQLEERSHRKLLDKIRVVCWQWKCMSWQ